VSGYVRDGRGGALRRRSAGIGRVVCIGGAFGPCRFFYHGIEASTMFMDNLDVHDAGEVAEMGWCALWDEMGI